MSVGRPSNIKPQDKGPTERYLTTYDTFGGGRSLDKMSSSFSDRYIILLPTLLTLVVLYKFIIHPAFISRLARIPNAHWSSPFSPIWILWIRYRRRENATVHAAHAQHGPILRLGPNEISVNGVDGGIRSVYGGGFEKGEWYSIFDNYGVPCMFSAWHSRHHSVRKRMISHVYSKTALTSSPALASQVTTILFERLLPIIDGVACSSSSQNGVDVHELWFSVTMDLITAYLFGLRHSSNFLQNMEYRRHWLRLYQGRKKYTYFSQELPRLKSRLQTIGIHLVPKWVDAANREIEAWCASMCTAVAVSELSKADYAKNPGDEPVVYNAMLAGMEKEKQSKGSDSVLTETIFAEPELSLASEMLDHLAAGHETSGITLTYLSWHLSRDLPLQATLRAELLTLDHPMKYQASLNTASKGFKPDKSNGLADIKLPSSKQLDSLPILHAVILETLRLDASIPGGLPRVTPYPSCNLAGYDVPGGVRVESAAWSLHRNSDVYPDPNAWDHTRWLPGNGGEAQKDQDRWFWPFSSGGRMCIGSNFAMHELKLIVAAVYTNFETFIVNDRGIEQEDGYTCGPKANRLELRFVKVDHEE